MSYCRDVVVTDRAFSRAWLLAAWRRMGLSGAVLSAAVLADVLVAAMSAITEGSPWPLLMLPGVFALAACAVFARRSPLPAALLGAAALVICSPFAQVYADSYVALLGGISISETVAGVQLVILAVRHLTPVSAFAATSALVAGGVAAVILRESLSGALTVFVGFALLVVGVTLGLRTREAPAGDEPSPPSTTQLAYLSHWPLIGGFALIIFTEFAQSSNSPEAVIGLLCSVGAATLAVFAVRHPVTAGLGLAAVFLLTAGLGLVLAGGFPGMPALPMPASQVVAGMVVVVHVIRERPLWPAAGVIATLSVAVAGAVLGRFWRADIGNLAFGALLLLGFAVAIGLYLKSRDSARGQALQAAVTEAQTAERMALARELHDVVAHHVTGIVVQAQAAKMLADQDPSLAQQALDRIDRAGVEAMSAMRRLVGSMRSGEAPDTAAATEQATTDLAADLRKLIASANHSVPTELELDVPADLPPEVARSALRIVQEALTNVGKHATGATAASVVVGVVDGQLGIRVSDDGRAQSSDRTVDEWRDSGYGLIGMRERVELLHGRLSAGPAPDGGWLVEVWLPLEDAAR